MSSMPKVLEKTLKKMNISPSEAYRNKNFETARIGCELCYLRESDVEFMLDKKDLMLRVRGSSNQRVIDVKETLKTGNE